MMKPVRSVILAALLLLCWSTAWAISPEEVERRTQALSSELRCPTCQALSVKDSDALFSKNIREKVRNLVEEGKSDEEVLAYFEERYGEFILRSPKPKGWGILAWLLPVAALVLGGGWLVSRLVLAQRTHAQQTQNTASGEQELTPEEKSRLERDLKRFEEGV